MRTMPLALLVVSMTVAAACSSSNDPSSTGGAGSGTGSGAAWSAGKCSPVGSRACANDTPATQANLDACEAFRTDSKCGASYVTYLQCIGAHVTCGADGKVDTAKLIGPCITPYTDHEFCVHPIVFDAGILDATGGG